MTLPFGPVHLLQHPKLSGCHLLHFALALNPKNSVELHRHRTMGKKKFIDKKKAATFRLVFKDSSVNDDVAAASGPERVFIRVDGGDNFVPGFSFDDQPPDSIFDDAEEDKEEDDNRSKYPKGSERGSKSDAGLPERVRRELVELGFADDGYNYLQHLREIGPSGRSGSFVPNTNLRLDRLRADVKAYDASRVQISSTEDADDDIALLVSSSASQIHGPATKVVDPDLARLLEIDDGSVLDSADELEDDFVSRANEGTERSATVKSDVERSIPTVETESSDGGEGILDFCNDEDRPARLLDEQFDLLALREYDDDEIGELDPDDPAARGSAHISEFSNVMSDFLISSSVVQDRYQTPADSNLRNFERQSNVHNNEEKEELIPDSHRDTANHSLFVNASRSSVMVDDLDSQSDSTEEDKELIEVAGSDEDEEQWDCESIVTTYSNLENHPFTICSFPTESKKQTLNQVAEASNSVIRLRGKQQLPVDFLPEKGRYSRVAKNEIVKCSNGAMDQKENEKCTSGRRAGESKEERKARKVAFKEEKRNARRVKKEMKLLYRSEAQRAQHGAAYTGPATIHLS